MGQRKEIAEVSNYIEMMLSFKRYLESSEEERDIAQTLSKLPKSHRALVHGYKFKFQDGNTLNGDDENVGYMDPKEKEIVVAAPWNYGREFTVLHEVAHRVWERLPEQLHHHWSQIVAHTQHKQDQPPELHEDPEELFCMIYAQYYSKNKIVKFHIPELLNLIGNLPQ